MRRIHHHFAASALACLLPLPALAADAPHPFTARDLQAMRRISEPQVSPRGDRVAFTLRTADFEANKGRTDLWVVGIDGKGVAQLTNDPANDSNPAWSPDGATLYFLSTRSGSSQVWRVPAAGGNATQVTNLPLDVSNLRVSPDGARLAFSLEVYTDCATIACTADRLKNKGPGSGRLYEGGVGFVRHWDTWLEGLRNHIFVMPVGGGDPVDVTRLIIGDAPSRPFGGVEEYAFAPDGKTLIFALRAAGREEPWSTNLDLWLTPADGSATPQDLTAANKATDTQPVFSPDGKTLAYLAMQRPGFESDRLRIHLRDMATGNERVLAESWDRSADLIVWSGDGKTIYTTAHDLGQVPLFAIDVASGAVKKLVTDGHVRDPGLAGSRLVCGRDTLRSPADLWSAELDGTKLVRLTDVNHEQLAAVLMGEPEQFQFEGANGDTVYGWATKPVGFDATKTYPLALLIHGGPQGSFNNEFHYRWNPQPFAGAGYAVVTIDFHGSVGYGQAFADAISKDWGGKPLVDLQRGLAAALLKYPWIDGDRACALGGSYGGFMTNWINGHWPDRFRCLVTHDGIFDQRMMYYATEELWFPEWEFGGPHWQNPQGYESANPAGAVEKWKTPTLVIHGELDYRIPVTQGLAAFNALQRLDVPAQLLVFPNENHWVLKPQNGIEWHDTVLAWLGRWTAKR
jgi:dipeptidyl aminopeptidase/acylaminoacyl peptidase